ncbi:MAG: hypothetical protein OEW18_14890, partial [Candidatus Aminicenantes bacterium]|nr:hypothetical protein [Candidatus Aminicenantes bacterium]
MTSATSRNKCLRHGCLALAALLTASSLSSGLFSQETPAPAREIPRDHVRVEKDVVYAEIDGHKLTLDIAYPDNLSEPA